MSDHAAVKRVRIYLSERDRAADQPLYLAVMDLLRREGATGATAIRGLVGFGAGQHLRFSSAPDSGQSPPIIIEWIDRAERVARVLPALDDLVPDAMITLEDLAVYRAALRTSGPFGQQTLAETIARDIATLDWRAPLRQAVSLMLERRQWSIPLLDEHNQLVGLFTTNDLVQRARMSLSPAVLALLTAEERATHLDTLPIRPLNEIVTTDLRTIYIESSIAQAVGMVVEWGLETLPVTNRDGQLVGLFDIEHALRAALDSHTPADPRVRNAETPTPVRLIMQQAVPTIPVTQTIAFALERLRALPERFLVVLDEGRPIGTLTDAHLLGQLDQHTRAAWLDALRAPESPLPPALLALNERTLRSLIGPLATIGVLATQEDATRLMLEQGYERLIVVDEMGRLAGLLARWGLVRALAQASANA